MKSRAAHVTLLTILGVATTVASWSCGVLGLSRNRAAVPVSHALAVDTTVVIIRVFNYQECEVTVYLDTQEDRQRVGIVTPMHEAFFVLPSTTVTALNEFILTVIPTMEGIKPYRTGLISRNPNKITMVYVAVGEEANKQGGYRSSAPTS
jgi:hypothetical protein